MNNKQLKTLIKFITNDLAVKAQSLATNGKIVRIEKYEIYLFFAFSPKATNVNCEWQVS
jgi:hypothetical protein